jgi:hypothetical protein
LVLNILDFAKLSTYHQETGSLSEPILYPGIDKRRLSICLYPGDGGSDIQRSRVFTLDGQRPQDCALLGDAATLCSIGVSVPDHPDIAIIPDKKRP